MEKIVDESLVLVEKVRKTGGKIRVGVNECTKAIERGKAKLVIIAHDTSPKEIIMHLPILCKEKNIPNCFVSSKKELGEKSGIEAPASSIAILEEGEAKKELESIIKKLMEK